MPRSIAIDVAEPERRTPAADAAELYGALPATLDALRDAAGGRRPGPWPGARWLVSLRATETEARGAEAGDLADPRAPLHPMRIYGELPRCSTATRS